MSRAWILARLALLLLIVQSASCDWKPPSMPKKEALCKTAECEARGKEYKNNLDARVSPCQDFYTYTCGNFHKNHPELKYAPEYSVMNVMNNDFARIIRQTLENYSTKPGDDPLFLKAKELYETCAKIPEYPISAAKEIGREVMKIGRVPNTPLWDIHYKYLQLSGESALFGYKILESNPTQGMPLLLIMEPSSAYGSIFHRENWTPQEEQAYTDFLFLVMKNLKLTGSDTLIKERIKKVFAFRKKFDRVIAKNFGRAPDMFGPLTGQQLDIWFLDNIKGITATQDIPWLEIVELLLENVPAHSQKIVAMRQDKYFIDLMDFLKNYSEEVIANHIEIYFIERHLKLNDNMFKLLEATSTEPHDLFRYIRERTYPRWQACIEHHNMEDTLEKLLFFKWFPKDYPTTVHQIINKLRVSIEKQMKKSKWMDEPTRIKTIRKLLDVDEWIGFPPWINGFGTPKERNKKETLKPNASLNIKQKRIYVHAPLLLPPVFSPTIPAVYNYGGMGTTLGHELYHIMDECGSYLLNGESVFWWPDEMRIKCFHVKYRFIKEYNEITNRDFKTRYGMDVKSDTSMTYNEDLPDVMGLEAAYNAYKELDKKEKSVCQTLPNFEKFSCDQMFYITFANTFCGYYTKKTAEDKLKIWDHSIDSVRINGAVSQMESFGKVFGCAAGTPMNPEKKVNLWQ